MELGVRIKKKWGAKIFIFNKVRVQKPQSPKNSAKRNRRYSGFWTLPSFISLCLCFLLVQEVFQQLLKLVLANFVISGVCYCIPSLGRIWLLHVVIFCFWRSLHLAHFLDKFLGPRGRSCDIRAAWVVLPSCWTFHPRLKRQSRATEQAGRRQ